jgi:hypothetical protein
MSHPEEGVLGAVPLIQTRGKGITAVIASHERLVAGFMRSLFFDPKNEMDFFNIF